MKVYFATNRLYLGSTKKAFDNKPSQGGDLRVGFCLVDETRDCKLVKSSVSVKPDNEARGSFAVFEELQKIMKTEKKSTLIHIHGYNNSFEQGVEAAATAAARYKAASDNRYDPNVIAFCWPSASKLLKYQEDRWIAQESGVGLARALIKYFQFLARQREAGIALCHQKLNLVCHSMGNYVLRHAVQKFISHMGSPSRLFDEVILTAADEDNDAFDLDYKLQPLANMARRVTVYFNREDSALWISDTTKGNVSRLGTTGPLHTHNLPANIKPVDVGRVVTGPVEHGYHLHKKCGIVHADMAATLLSVPSQEIDGRIFVPQSNKFEIV